MTSASRIVVYSIGGNQLAELALASSRSWILNRYGTCELAVPQSNINFVNSVFTDGNLIVAYSEDMPTWGGVVTSYQKWMRDGSCIVTCFSAEWMLNYRTLKAALGGGADFIFTSLINIANSVEPLPVVLGSINVSPPVLINNGAAIGSAGDHLYDVLATMLRLCNLKYDFQLVQDAYGHPVFQANLYSDVGEAVSGFLEEGFNCVLPPGIVMQSLGNLANRVYGYVQGAPTTAPPVEEDLASQSQYHVREDAITVQSGVDPKPFIKASVKTRKQPQNIWTLIVTNVGGVFKSLKVGSTLPLITHSMPFNQKTGQTGGSFQVLITSMAYSDTNPTVTITVEELAQ